MWCTSKATRAAALAGVTALSVLFPSGAQASPSVVVEEFPIAEHVWASAVDASDIYVLGADASGSHLFKVDAKSGAVQGSAWAGDNPYDLAVGFGSVWVTDYTEDGSAGVVRRFASGSMALQAVVTVGHSPVDVTVGGGAVFVANHRGEAAADGTFLPSTVMRIDPARNLVTHTARVGVPQFCCGAQGLDYGDGRLWVSVPNASALVAVDAATLGAPKSIKVRPACGGVSYYDSAVYAAGGGCSPGVLRVDTASFTKLEDKVGAGPTADAEVAFGLLWTSSFRQNRVVLTDPTSLEVVALPYVPDPGALTVGAATMWVTSWRTGSLFRLTATAAR